MPCDTLAEFRDLATYRKSFNGDLMMAKSRPQKFYFFETFPFETTKGPLLVLGKIDKSLLDEVKKLGKTMRAKGECSFKDNVVALHATDGKLTEDMVRKALALANVRREFTLGDGDASVAESKGSGEALGLPPEKFTAARGNLQKLLDKAKDLAWKDADFKRGKEADDKVNQVERYIAEVGNALTAGEAGTKALATQLQMQAKDTRAKFFKTEFDASTKLLARQQALVKEVEKEVADLKRRLISLRLLAKELTASSRIFELKLQGAGLKYSVHGDKTRTLHNEKDVLKALGTLIVKHAPKPTASKFLNADLELEAIYRAVGVAQKECLWTEVQANGRWSPLDSLVVFVGKPATGAGWAFVNPADVGPPALKAIDEALDDFREGKTNTAQAMGAVDAALKVVADHARGADAGAPMIASARVTLARQGGRWASVSHYPDKAAAPPGWNLKGKSVRLKTDSPPMVAPACRGA
ncbi:MAG: hypothetical protein ABIO45_13025 [Burkholderiaceae bacterium]